MSYALGIDPGGMVGYSVYPLLTQHFSAELVESGQTPVENFIDWARTAIQQDWYIFMERFTITANTARLTAGGSHDALDCIGVVKTLCRWAGAEFKFQTPAQAKKFVNDSQLKTLGLWIPGQDHARDAIRHLIFGIVYSTSGGTCKELKNLMAG
jgi:hypothetical protein